MCPVQSFYSSTKYMGRRMPKHLYIYIGMISLRKVEQDYVGVMILISILLPKECHSGKIVKHTKYMDSIHSDDLLKFRPTYRLSFTVFKLQQL